MVLLLLRYRTHPQIPRQEVCAASSERPKRGPGVRDIDVFLHSYRWSIDPQLSASDLGRDRLADAGPTFWSEAAASGTVITQSLTPVVQFIRMLATESAEAQISKCVRASAQYSTTFRWCFAVLTCYWRQRLSGHFSHLPTIP